MTIESKPSRRVEFGMLLAGCCAYIALALAVVDFSTISDDQATYIAQAMAMEEAFHWKPPLTFALLLLWGKLLFGNYVAAKQAVFVLTAVCYVFAAYVAFRFLLRDRAVSLALTLISMTPHFTLGMTFWGFAGSAFITARILIIPFVCLLLAVYFRYLRRPAVYLVLPACAILSVVHLSAVYLMCAFAGTAVLLIGHDLLRKQRLYRRPVLHLVLVGIAFFSSLAFVRFAVLSLQFNDAVGQQFRLFSTLDQITTGEWSAHLAAMPLEALVSILWESAYFAFWWTMFPPRLADIAYVVLENALLLGAAGAGLLFLGRRLPVHRRATLAFLLAVVVVAYGYQVLRFVLWKAAHMPPSLYEEVRTFKYAHFALFLWAGFLLRKIKAARGVTFLALALPLSLSPTQVVASLPIDFRWSLAAVADSFITAKHQREYVRKALNLWGAERRVDLQKINEILDRLPGTTRILSTEHKLKGPNRTVLISYQDKRGSGLLLSSFHLTFLEIRDSIESGDPPRILSVARKYGTSMVVLPRKVHHGRLHNLYSGNRLHLYAIRP